MIKKNKYSILFNSILFYYILIYSILFNYFLFYSIIIVQKSRVDPLFCSNYFHKESTLSEKPIPFS